MVFTVFCYSIYIQKQQIFQSASSINVSSLCYEKLLQLWYIAENSLEHVTLMSFQFIKGFCSLEAKNKDLSLWFINSSTLMLLIRLK